MYIYEQGEQKCYDFELFWLHYWFFCFVFIFFAFFRSSTSFRFISRQHNIVC